MKNFSNKKNKIVLSDYNYRRDIEHRAILSNLSIFELEVLQEIVDGSLKISLNQLAETLEVDLEKLSLALEKLKPTGLFIINNSYLVVDKEMRKFYETQIWKFNDYFRPGLEYLQTLLNKVPQHLIHSWYPLFRTSDNLFNAIVEKYLLTPKMYERYLQEIGFENPILNQIQKDVFENPDFKVFAEDIIKKYNLQREEFEEYLLHLEYNCVCYLSYEKKDNQWEEIITPLSEWQDYLKYKRDYFPKSIKSIEEIETLSADEFAKIKSFNHFLEDFLHKKILDTSKSHFLKRAQQLHLLTHQDNHWEITSDIQNWLEQPLPNQAYSFYNLFDDSENLFEERDMREIEKNFKNISHLDWIYFDDFLKSISVSFGKYEPFVLRNKGKKWKYIIPEYTENEKKFIYHVVCEKLHEAGMVKLGFHKGRLCLKVTDFGYGTLCE